MQRTRIKVFEEKRLKKGFAIADLKQDKMFRKYAKDQNQGFRRKAIEKRVRYSRPLYCLIYIVSELFYHIYYCFCKVFRILKLKLR